MVCRVSFHFVFFILVLGFVISAVALCLPRGNAAALASGNHAIAQQQQIPTVDSLVSTRLYHGSSKDGGVDITVDDDGFIYVVGNTESSNFPVVNAYDDSFNGESDGFLMKISDDLESVLYATFIGGSGYDYVESLTVDSLGHVYIIGQTNSPDFPMTVNASLDSATGTDVFVMKVDSLDGSPVFSVRLGGSDGDYGNAIAVDNEGDVHVTGTTFSNDFPLVYPTDETLNGTIDCFLSTLSSNGTLVFSSYLGGSGQDYSYDLDVGPEGYVYITGATESEDFPSASQGNATVSGGFDSFIIKYNQTDHSLVYSTLVGGDLHDSGGTLEVDTWGNAYVGGRTNSFDFPVVNAFDSSFGGGRDGFVFKLDADGETLHYSSYLGDYHEEYVNALAVDQHGFAYLAGFTLSLTFPIEDSLSDKHYGGLWDAFVVKVSQDGNSLEYSTFLGGSEDESGKGIVLSSDGDALITGFTHSVDFAGTEVNASRFTTSSCFLAQLSDLTDSDNDGLLDSHEIEIGTDIHQVDSDQDSIDDYWEVVNGYDPLDPDVSIIEFLQYHSVTFILGISLITVIVVLFLGRYRLRKLQLSAKGVIEEYRQCRSSGGSVPHGITVALVISTLAVPYAVIPWTVNFTYDFVMTVHGAVFAILWVILPGGSYPSGFQLLSQTYVLLGIILGIFNILFGVQVHRFCRKQTSWNKVILSGALTLVVPFVFLAVFLFSLLAHPTYIGPIPIQLLIGLTIAWLLKTPEEETPWID